MFSETSVLLAKLYYCILSIIGHYYELAPLKSILNPVPALECIGTVYISRSKG